MPDRGPVLVQGRWTEIVIDYSTTTFEHGGTRRKESATIAYYNQPGILPSFRIRIRVCFTLESNIIDEKTIIYVHNTINLYIYIHILYVEVGSRHSIPFDSFSFLFPLKSIHLLTELSNWLRKERKKKIWDISTIFVTFRIDRRIRHVASVRTASAQLMSASEE